MKNKKIESEINFKALLKSPLRLFGWIYVYFFIVLLLIGIYFVKNLDYISFNAVLPAPVDSTKIFHDVTYKVGGLKPAINLNQVFKSSPEIIAKGKELFDLNCQSCHGSEGKGDGAASAALNPKPRNFHSPQGWVNGRKFSEIYKTLQFGIIKNGMASYEYIPPEDRFAIIHYLRTFSDFPEFTGDELTDMDAEYNLSAETMTPNQVPVETALRKLESDYSDSVVKIDTLYKIILNDGSISALILKNSVYDLKEVLTSFIKSEHGDYKEFSRSVLSEPSALGFKSNVVNLSNQKWKDLFNYLIKVSRSV